MLGADYGERGGIAASRASSTVHSPADNFSFPAPAPSTSLDDTDSSTWSSLGHLTGNTSATNLSPAHISQPAAAASSSFNTKLQPQDRTSSNLDLSTPETLARNELFLRGNAFTDWNDNVPSSPTLESPEELQKQDPLGTQIWKLYSRTKSRLPNQERMENLTWRMMAMNLRRREQQAQAQAQAKAKAQSEAQAAYAQNLVPGSASRPAGTDFLLSSKQVSFKPSLQSSAPSGIAQQLRQSVDKSAESEPLSDSMNLDDFIIPSSVASPAGITTPAPTEGLTQSRPVQPSNMPIPASRNMPQVQIPRNLPPASLPQSSIAYTRSSEFDYVQRRVRKTSIDERRGVSIFQSFCSQTQLISYRTENAPRNSHLKSHPSLFQIVQAVMRRMTACQTIP